jgi:hypothetical protein
MIKKTCGIKAIVVLSILILCLSHSYSDDTLVADYGKTVAPIKTNDISMVEEEVIITIDDYIVRHSGIPLRRAHVKCTFLFKNTSDKVINTIVGFPGNDQGEETYSSPITDFVTVCNGLKYDIKIKKEILKENKKEKSQLFRNWYIWEMKFPANSDVKVENSYNHILSAPSNYEPFYLKYELSTGSNWKGNIGKATIKVIYKNAEELEKRVCEIKPKGWVRNQNEIIWNLNNIKPTEADNISISERNLGYDYSSEAERKPLLFRKK